MQKVPVLQAQCRQIAGARADDGQHFGRRQGFRKMDGAVGVALRTPHDFTGGEQKRLQRLRAVGPAEIPRAGRRFKPVLARTLAVADALRQRAGLVERVVNDRAIPDLRPDTTVTGPMQRIQQCLKPGAWEKTRLHARLVGLP